MKKTSLLLTAVLTIGLALSGCGSSTTKDAKSTEGASKEPTKLVISTWGFNEDLLRKNVFEPFEKANNVKIVLEVGNNSERLNKIKSMNGNSGVDIIYLANSFAGQAAEAGLLEVIDRSKIPNIKNIYEIAKAPLGEKYGPAYTLNRTGIVYDSATVKTPVKSWADLWSGDFKGKVTIPEITTTAGPIMVIVAGTYAGKDVKESSEGAFAALTKLKPNLVKTYTKSSDLVNMFAQKEVEVGVVQDFAFANIKKAVPTAVWVDPSEGSYVNLNSINIVKGTKNKELSEKFINWILSEEVQKANALAKVEAPVNINVKLTEEESKDFTYGTKLIESLKSSDDQFVNSVMKEWIDKWNRGVSN